MLDIKETIRTLGFARAARRPVSPSPDTIPTIVPRDQKLRGEAPYIPPHVLAEFAERDRRAANPAIDLNR